MRKREEEDKKTSAVVGWRSCGEVGYGVSLSSPLLSPLSPHTHLSTVAIYTPDNQLAWPGPTTLHSTAGPTYCTEHHGLKHSTL